MQPTKHQLYPLSKVELAEFWTQLKTFLDLGHRVPNLSPQRPFILFTEMKGRASLRMCIGYKALNLNSINNAWLLLCIDDFWPWLCGAKFFSKLDLHDGYYQIPTHLSNHFKTAFAGHYRSFKLL